RCVARAGVVALVGGAGEGVGGCGRPVVTGVGLGAGVAIVAGGAVGLFGGRRADGGRGVARAGVVALVGGADDGVGAGTRPVLAGIGLGAGVAVVACGAIGLVGVRAACGGRGVGGRVVTLIRGGAGDWRTDAHLVVTVVAGRARVGVRAYGACRRRVAADTILVLALFSLGAGIAVVAQGPIRLAGARSDGRRRRDIRE